MLYSQYRAQITDVTVVTGETIVIVVTDGTVVTFILSRD